MDTTNINKFNLRKLFKQIIIYFPGKVIPAFIGLASAAIFTRIFDTEEYGKYSLVLSFAILLVNIFSQWLEQSIRRYVPGIENKEKKYKIKQIIVISLIIIVFIIFILYFLLSIFNFIFKNYLIEWKIFYLPITLFILTQILFLPLTIFLQSEMRAKEFTQYNLSNFILKFAFSLLLIFFISYNIANLLWGAILANLLLIPLLYYKIGFPAPISCFNRKQLKNNLIEIKKFLIYGLPLTGWFIADAILNFGDRYVIQWFRGASEVGIYSANYKLINGAVGLVSVPIIMATHPFLIKAWNNADKKGAANWISFIIEWLSIIGILLISFTFLFKQDLALLFLGEEFRSGCVILPIVITGFVFWKLGVYTHISLQFAEKTKLMLFLASFVALLNLLLNIIFVPKFGYIAAAYTTLFSYFIYTIITGIKGQSVIKWLIEWKKLIINFILISIFTYFIQLFRINVLKQVNYVLNIIITLSIFLIMAIITIFIEYRAKKI